MKFIMDLERQLSDSKRKNKIICCSIKDSSEKVVTSLNNFISLCKIP